MINESLLDYTTLRWFESLGWQTAFGSDINPNIPPDAINEAVRKITRTESPSLIENNRRFHRMLTDSVDVEVISEDDYDSVRHVEDTGL